MYTLHQALISSIVESVESGSPLTDPNSIIEGIINLHEEKDHQGLRELDRALRGFFMGMYEKDMENLEHLKFAFSEYNKHLSLKHDPSTGIAVSTADTPEWKNYVDHMVGTVSKATDKIFAVEYLSEYTLDTLCTIADTQVTPLVNNFGVMRQWYHAITGFGLRTQQSFNVKTLH